MKVPVETHRMRLKKQERRIESVSKNRKGASNPSQKTGKTHRIRLKKQERRIESVSNVKRKTIDNQLFNLKIE